MKKKKHVKRSFSTNEKRSAEVFKALEKNEITVSSDGKKA